MRGWASQARRTRAPMAIRCDRTDDTRCRFRAPAGRGSRCRRRRGRGRSSRGDAASGSDARRIRRSAERRAESTCHLLAQQIRRQVLPTRWMRQTATPHRGGWLPRRWSAQGAASKPADAAAEVLFGARRSGRSVRSLASTCASEAGRDRARRAPWRCRGAGDRPGRRGSAAAPGHRAPRHESARAGFSAPRTRWWRYRMRAIRCRKTRPRNSANVCSDHGRMLATVHDDSTNNRCADAVPSRGSLVSDIQDGYRPREKSAARCGVHSLEAFPVSGCSRVSGRPSAAASGFDRLRLPAQIYVCLR